MIYLLFNLHTNRAPFSKIRSLFLQNQGTCFLFSQKGRGDVPPSPPPASSAFLMLFLLCLQFRSLAALDVLNIF